MRTIEYKVSYEKLISRLPALFAFVFTDEQEVTKIVKATEGLQGNYGQIVADILYNKGDFPSKSDNDNKTYVCKDGTELKVTSGIKSYRTLIDTYYKAINDKEWDRDTNGIYTEPFLAFMEKGIGLKYVGLSEDNETVCGNLKKKKIYPLAPDYIYLGEARTMYNKVIKIKKQLDFWGSHTKMCKEDLRYYEALKEEYEMMRGDILKSKLEELILEAEDVATEYLEYAVDSPRLNFNVNLTNTIKDLGMVTPYIQEWVEGKRYYHGDVVYHIDMYGYGMTWECNLEKATGESEKAIKTDEFGRQYINGQYDEETELIYFEDGTQEVFDGKEPYVYWYPQSLNWVKENENEHYVKGDMPQTVKIKGTVNSHLASLRKYESYMNRNDVPETPDNYKDWLWYYRLGAVVNREGKYDENGNVAVMYGENIDDNSIYANGIQAIINEKDKEDKLVIGKNILFIKDKNNKEWASNLAMWGDVITDITATNNEEGTGGVISFTYWLGVHLKAEKDKDENGTWYSVDDDGNYKYYFKNITADIDIRDANGNIITEGSPYGKNQGVKYTESYIYYQGDTDMEALIDFRDGPKLQVNDTILGINVVVSEYKTTEYLENYDEDYEPREVEGKIVKVPKEYTVIKPFINGRKYKKGEEIPYSTYKQLSKLTYTSKENIKENITAEMFGYLTEKNQLLCTSGGAFGYIVNESFEDDNKKKCKPIEETIWTLVDRGVYEDGKGKTYFQKYIEGEFDKDFDPEDVDDKDTNAPYYYKLYDKMEFSTENNLYVYDIKIGNRMKKVPYLRTNYETYVDIRHVDVEKTFLIRYDYFNGVNFQPSMNKDVNIERGVTQAFEKHIKFSEVKTFEDLENYANGGFFVMSKENIDLG